MQALARIPLQQLRADRRAGLRTAAFASGYPGSPLAGYAGEVASGTFKVGDEVEVCLKSKECDMFKHSLGLATQPAYVTVTDRDLKARYTYQPEREEIPVICDVPTVVEFYSR